jgi:predicted nucleic acid-binding protein
MGRDDRVAQFEASLSTVEVLPFDDAAGRLAGRINADLESKGRIIGMPDVMIAAIALQNALPLVTGNVAHFEAVRSPGYALTIENWKAG